jgi:hypothetical protein
MGQFGEWAVGGWSQVFGVGGKARKRPRKGGWVGSWEPCREVPAAIPRHLHGELTCSPTASYKRYLQARAAEQPIGPVLGGWTGLTRSFSH